MCDPIHEVAETSLSREGFSFVMMLESTFGENKMKLFVPSGFLVLTLAIAPVACIADPVHTAPTNALTVQQALRMLQDQGYYDFKKIKLEQDEDEIEVEARNKIGHKVEIELDLYTGQVLTIEHD